MLNFTVLIFTIYKIFLEFLKMRLLIVAMLMVGLSFGANAQKPSTKKDAVKSGNVELITFQDSIAYAIGVNIGGNLLKDSLFLNLDIVKAGLNDVLYAKKELLTKEQLEAVFQKFSATLQEKQMKEQAKTGSVNSQKGAAFLAENAKKPGVKVTPSGLQYEIITEGTGAKPTASDKVKVHYIGTLIDGTKFDSSVDRGEPVSFPLGNVIKGWTEGLQLMPIGSKFRFFIPGDLAYGERSPSEQIGPNETLIFEVELIDIEK